MTVDQLRAIPQAVLANLTADRRDLIISLLQKYSQMSTAITVKVTPSTNASFTIQAQVAMTNELSPRTTKATFSDVVPASTNPSDSNYQIPNGSTTAPQNPNAPSNGQTFSTKGSPNSQVFSSQGPINGQALYTQGPPNGQVPDNLPDVINASNIKLFLNNIGSKLSTEDVQRIDPSAVSELLIFSLCTNLRMVKNEFFGEK